ncbi:MAG: PHP domain-containing protein [Pseudomonadota bacterium]
MDLIDLHTHTTASDGSFSPGRVVELALAAGLKAVGVTDHDSTDGLDEALAKGRDIGLEVVPGVEISAEFQSGTMHVLGYYMDYREPEFKNRLTALQDGRRNRNPNIVCKLNGLGLELTMDEVRAESGGGQVGRPHFARVLIRKGYVATTEEAFDLYLGKGRPAYVDKFRFFPREAVQMILQAGGLPVLAHPSTLKLSREGLEALVAELKAAGLVGLEAYYSTHSPEMIEDYLALCGRFDLVPTGGSDFHGESKKDISLGTGRGDLAVPLDILQRLKNRSVAKHE